MKTSYSNYPSISLIAWVIGIASSLQAFASSNARMDSSSSCASSSSEYRFISRRIAVLLPLSSTRNCSLLELISRDYSISRSRAAQPRQGCEIICYEIPGWRHDKSGLTLGYFISRFQREDMASLTVGLRTNPVVTAPGTNLMRTRVSGSATRHVEVLTSYRFLFLVFSIFGFAGFSCGRSTNSGRGLIAPVVV
jgi:hypothetical protein